MIVATNETSAGKVQFLVQVFCMKEIYYIMLRWHGKKLVCPSAFLLKFDEDEPRFKFIKNKRRHIVSVVIEKAKQEVLSR